MHVPASFCLFLCISHYNFNNTNSKSIDGVLGPQNGRRSRNHWAIAAALNKFVHHSRQGLKVVVFVAPSSRRRSSTTFVNAETSSTSACSPMTAPCLPTKSSLALVAISSGKSCVKCSLLGALRIFLNGCGL